MALLAFVLLATVLLSPAPAMAETKIGDMIYFTHPFRATNWQVQLWVSYGGAWTWVSKFGTRSVASPAFDRYDFYNVTDSSVGGAGLGWFRVESSVDGWKTWQVCASTLIDWHTKSKTPRAAYIDC
jgi:hypothetical protein